VTAPYLHGCNYPWSTDGSTVFYGLDFGINVWGSHLGVSTRRDAVARDLGEVAALGFTVARWFVFCDGRAGIAYDERGLPSALDARFFEDLDAALELARGQGLRLALVLLDHRWMFEGLVDRVPDPVTGTLVEVRLPSGRAPVLLTRAGREALFDRVLIPVVSRYGPAGVRADLADVVAAYEFMNEPDFVVEEWEKDLTSRAPRPLPFAVLGELVGRFSDVVHQCSTAFTTIAAARLRNLWAWDDPALGIDVVQVHSYPDTRRALDDDVYGRAARSLGVRLPVLLGEFPGNGPERHPRGASPPPTTLDDYLAFAVEGGYVGAWPWSFSGTDAYGRLPEARLQRFAARYPHLVNPRCRYLQPTS
jgi:hypothetical protein